VLCCARMSSCSDACRRLATGVMFTRRDMGVYTHVCDTLLLAIQCVLIFRGVHLAFVKPELLTGKVAYFISTKPLVLN